MRTVRHTAGVPGDGVRCNRVLGSEIHPIEPELDADHADIVGRCRLHEYRTGNRSGRGMSNRHRRRRRVSRRRQRSESHGRADLEIARPISRLGFKIESRIGRKTRQTNRVTGGIRCLAIYIRARTGRRQRVGDPARRWLVRTKSNGDVSICDAGYGDIGDLRWGHVRSGRRHRSTRRPGWAVEHRG